MGKPSYPSLVDVRQRVIAAVVALYRYDHELLDKDANERSITHKLAEHLQREFPYWHVDCEYNRLGSNAKRLRLPLVDEQTCTAATEARTVYPDIIVHRRGTQQNLVVIEVKKQGGAPVTEDEAKIKAFSKDSGYAYQYGLLLTIGPGSPTLKRYQPNDTWDDWSQDLCDALKEPGYGG